MKFFIYLKIYNEIPLVFINYIFYHIDDYFVYICIDLLIKHSVNMKKEQLLIQNTGLGYDILSCGIVLCSFPTLRLAMNRAHDIISELGLSHEVVYIGYV